MHAVVSHAWRGAKYFPRRKPSDLSSNGILDKRLRPLVLRLL
jgi:hypothetical protein